MYYIVSIVYNLNNLNRKIIVVMKENNEFVKNVVFKY